MNYTVLEFDVLPSTSDFLKEHHPYFPHLTFIRAGYQEKGRGQFDRTWESQANENLLFSLLLKSIDIKYVDKLKKWVLFELIHFFKSHGITPYFKEPNDLYVDDHKLCGILIESLSRDDMFDVVVIGIGINVNQTLFHTPNAISMRQLTHQIYDLPTLFITLVKSLSESYPFHNA